MMTSPERRIGWSRPLTIALAVTAVIILGGCVKTRHVDAAEFLEKSKVPVGDVHLVRFVGVREGRAWLEEWSYWPVLGERTRRLWTEADGLAPDVLRNLEAKRVEYERRIAEERRRNLGG